MLNTTDTNSMVHIELMQIVLFSLRVLYMVGCIGLIFTFGYVCIRGTCMPQKIVITPDE